MSDAVSIKATSNRFDTWSLINWREVENSVRSTQIKIADATRAQDWRRVRRLQNGLTNSFRAKLLAVKVVTSNKDKDTPGVDGILWNTDARKLAGAKSLIRRGYKPSPLRLVEIPKKNGQTRPLGIPTMRDRAMQCLYKFALEPVAEILADKDPYGFRPKRRCQNAIEQLFSVFGQKHSAKWILEGAIEKCSNQISHEWLMQNVHMDRGILDKWLKAGFIWNGALFPTRESTPQGGIMSPVLANLALDRIEDVINAKFGWKSGQRKKLCIHLVRYAGDFIITCSREDILKEEVMPLLNEFLSMRGLKLSASKTRITRIEHGFDFLGFNIRKYKGKVLIKPSKESVERFLREVKNIFSSNKSEKQSKLIRLLNRKIQGWCNYYKHVVSKETFSYIRFRIWRMCWRWSVRRHPNKGRKWVKDRYFREIKGNNWRFSDEKEAQTLIDPSTIPIRGPKKNPKEY